MTGLCEREDSVVKPPAKVWAHDKLELIKKWQFSHFKICLHSEEVSFFKKIFHAVKKLQKQKKYFER